MKSTANIAILALHSYFTVSSMKIKESQESTSLCVVGLKKLCKVMLCFKVPIDVIQQITRIHALFIQRIFLMLIKVSKSLKASKFHVNVPSMVSMDTVAPLLEPRSIEWVQHRNTCKERRVNAILWIETTMFHGSTVAPRAIWITFKELSTGLSI